jgi:hypothetical protein
MRRWVVTGVLSLFAVHTLAAQTGAAVEGGFEFVSPVGARSMGLGLAVVPNVAGSEAIWWNPAGVVRARREIQVNSTSSISSAGSLAAAEADVSISAAYTVPRVMSFGLGLRYVNYGSQEAATDPNGASGTFVSAAYLLAASFAAPFGSRLSVGTTLKVLTIPFDCTGTCPNHPQNNPVTGAVDAGAQYAVRRDSSITLGVALRNIGFALQFNDSPQSDALPRRLDMGIDIAPKLSQYPGLGVHVAAAAVFRVGSEAAGSGPGFRVGGEVSWLNRYYGRGGYINAGPGDDSGPTIGAGFNVSTRWQIDFARFLSENGAAVGLRPTFFSLRYSF